MKKLSLFLALSLTPFFSFAEEKSIFDTLDAELREDLQVLIEKQKELIPLQIKKQKNIANETETQELAKLQANYETLFSNLAKHDKANLKELQDGMEQLNKASAIKIIELRSNQFTLQQQIARDNSNDEKVLEDFLRRQETLNQELLQAVAEFNLLKQLELKLATLLIHSQNPLGLELLNLIEKLDSPDPHKE